MLGPNSGVRRAGDQIATDGLKQTLLLASKGNLVQSSRRWLPHRVIEGGGGEEGGEGGEKGEGGEEGEEGGEGGEGEVL